MSFYLDQLRAGSGRQSAVAAACTELMHTLGRHGVDPAMLGTVAEAAAFHTAVLHVLDRQRADVRAESGRRAELAERADATAGLGAGLITETATVAAAGVAASGR